MREYDEIKKTVHNAYLLAYFNRWPYSDIALTVSRYSNETNFVKCYDVSLSVG